MILYFSGTGNSRYLARRIAEGLDTPLYDLNACIKAGDTAPVQTGRDVVLVTPTYAWRIPRVVWEWLGNTELTGGGAHLVCDGLRQRDRQCGKIQSAACSAKAAAVHGHSPDHHAGKLHCHV